MNGLLNILIPILMLIESNANPNAIGDKGASVGVLQIKAITVKDVNRIVGKNQFTLSDRKDVKKSIAMCRIYLGHYGKKIMQRPISTREKLKLLGRIWNGGPSGYKKRATYRYSLKVEKLYRQYGGKLESVPVKN